MTISSSMNASVAGLAANATRLSTISDNIANSSTFGYKRVEADFHSMVIGSNKGSYTAGGVRATTQRLIDQRGGLSTTNNATDLAVRGGGMIPVMADRDLDRGVQEVLLATTGSFRPDDRGYLRTDNGLALLGWPARPDGTVPAYPRDTGAGLEPVRVGGAPLRGQPTTEIELALNLPATSTVPGAEGPTEIMSVEYFDNLGMRENLRIDFTPAAENQWTMTIRDSAKGDDSVNLVGEFTLVFNDTREGGGELTAVVPVLGAWDADTGQITVGVGEYDDPISVAIGRLNEPNGITQLSDTFAPVSVDKNGTPLGNMVSVEVDPRGYVTASYDNGMNLVLYQIPLVAVANVNALEALDGQAYRATRESGSILLWAAGDGPTGDLVSYAREESTTDVAAELTDLIRTQRAYSSNAKVIQTVDEMLQETTNIKR